MGTNRPQVNISFVDPETIDESASLSPSHERHIAARGRNFSIGLVLVLLVLAVFGVALRGQFLFLDDVNLTTNLALRTWGSGLYAIWAHPTIWPQYEPAWYSFLLLQYKLFSTKLPAGYIAVSLLLHAANVTLLWTLLRKLELPGALAAAMVFAVHPVNVEAIAWISQQSMLLCGTFSLAAMLMFLRHRGINPAPAGMRGWLGLPESNLALMIWSNVLLFLAMASNPMGLSLPLVLAVIIWWERGRVTKQDWITLLPLAMLAAIWLAVVMVGDARRSSIADDTGVVTSVLIQCRAAWIYLMHIVAPLGLSFGYPKWSTDGVLLQSLFALAIVIAMAGLWIARHRFGRGPIAAAGIFALGLVPAMFIQTSPARYAAFVSDHLVYLSSIVVVVAIAAAITPLMSRFNARWVRPATAALVLVVLTILTLIRLPDYRTSDQLWSTALRSNPNSLLAHNQLGLIELHERKDNALAMVHFRKALETSGDDVPTLLNIAEAYSAGGDLDKARMCYLQALAADPKDARAHFGIAGVLARLNQSDAAVDAYKASIKLDPGNPLAHVNLGLLLAERGETDRAIAAYEEATRLNPSLTVAYINHANLLFERFANGADQANIGKAVAMLERAIAVDPGNYGAYLNAGVMATRIAQANTSDEGERKSLLGQAEKFFRKSVSLEPASAEGHANLAVVLMLQNRLDDSVFEWIKASSLAPENQDLQRSLAKARQAAAASRAAASAP